MKDYRNNDDVFGKFEDRAGQLFNVMFGPLDEKVLEFVQKEVDDSTPDDMRKISKILRYSHSSFVFEQRGFVTRFLDKSKKHGKDVLDSSIYDLHHSAACGVRTRISGEPSSKDIELRKGADKALQGISKFSSAYRLYELLKKDADGAINSSRKECEAFDDE